MLNSYKLNFQTAKICYENTIVLRDLHYAILSRKSHDANKSEHFRGTTKKIRYTNKRPKLRYLMYKSDLAVQWES